MRQIQFATLAVVLASVVTYLIGEGVYAVFRWGSPETSVTYRLYQRVADEAKKLEASDANDDADKFEISGVNEDIIDDADEDIDADVHPWANLFKREGPRYTWLLEEEELDRLIPKFKASGVALGNVPPRFNVLYSEKVAVNQVVGNCRAQIPILRMTMTFLRVNAFNPFDPPNMFFDTASNLDPEIKELIATYGVRQITHTTNQNGERTTLPVVASDRKVIIAGSSQANGLMVNDSETLSSQLQALDRSRQYVNLGVGSIYADEEFCFLEHAVERYHGQVDELIFVYSEAEFRPGERYGQPEEIVDWLKTFAKAKGIGKVTIVFSPKIYSIVPQVTRLGLSHSKLANTFARERARLPTLAVDAGFRFINFADIALAEVARAGTQFAALSVFVDHGHWSPYGTARLAERMLQDKSHSWAPSTPFRVA